MRLIDADALKRDIKEKRDCLDKSGAVGRGEYVALSKALTMINEQPTADAVTVVRCGECAHNCGRMDGYICCDKAERISIWHSEDWFCADGERRNGDDLSPDET